MRRSLLLLRHGRTAFNAQGRMQGQLDTELDQVGLEQVAEAAPAVAALGPAVVGTSDLQRARVTAEVVAAAAGATLVVDPRLREVDAGRWQGLTALEAGERYPAEHAAWRRGEDIPRGGGERWADVVARALPAALALVEGVADGELAVVVTHGGTARVVTAALLGLPVEQRWRVCGLGNCCWSVLLEQPQGWQLAEHGVRAPARVLAGGVAGGVAGDREALG